MPIQLEKKVTSLDIDLLCTFAVIVFSQEKKDDYLLKEAAWTCT